MLGMLPGIGKIKKQLDDANIDEKHHQAPGGDHLVDDQARAQNPKLLNGSRRRRIAAGSGTTVPEINRLLKQYQDMAGMMKKMKKLGQQGPDAPRAAGADAARRLSTLETSTP